MVKVENSLIISPSVIFDDIRHIDDQIFDSWTLAREYPQFEQDFKYSQQFLISYKNSSDTYTTYRRELERFLQWSWLIAKTPIKDIRRKTFEEYLTIHQRTSRNSGLVGIMSHALLRLMVKG